MKVQEIVEKTEEYKRLEQIIDSINRQIKEMEDEQEGKKGQKDSETGSVMYVSGWESYRSDNVIMTKSYIWAEKLTLDELRELAEDFQAKKDALEV